MDPRCEYVCGLIDFQSYYSIPNINESNNKFHYVCKVKRQEVYTEDLSNLGQEYKNFLLYSYETRCVEIPIGSYEIDEIIECLKKILPEEVKLSIIINKNTLKSEITCNKTLEFFQSGSIGSVFGFNKSKLEPKDGVHISVRPINIFSVNAIRIECNLTTGAYINGKIAHTIHEFFPTVATGYKIVEVPKNVIYLPITVSSIHTLNLNILDQDDNIIDFRGETITCRIHVKKL